MATTSTTELKVKVNPKVSYGLISIGGIVLALAQYLLAVGNALSAGEINGGSLGLIATATATFITVASGRYKQASDVIKNITPVSNSTVAADGSTLAPETNVLYLDGKELATAIVKTLNTNAILASMQQPTPATNPAPEPPTEA